MALKTIVWDIDDVLNDLTRAWFGRYRQENSCAVREYAGLTENPPHRLLGITKTDYLASLDRFRLSPEAAAMKPDPAVIDWFNTQGENFRHFALTARPLKTIAPAVQWLMLHFGEWFQAVGFVPSLRPDENPRQPHMRKADFLSWLDRADYFIDDSPENISQAEGLGIRSFLIAQPWNDASHGLPEVLEMITKETGLGEVEL